MFNDVKYAELFRFFEEISKIPRGSGNEGGIANYLEAFAAERGLYCYRDDINNIFIKKDAVGEEYAEHAPVLLQGHTDMVCEAAAGTEHNFLLDGIKLVRDGDILHADGTTLGADDGCAVAAMLAILDSSSLKHPPLECLFTVGEEVGMDGMDAFDCSKISARRMINLDSAGEGVATVACAGGVRCDYSGELEVQSLPSGYSVYSMCVSGLYGGHSGEDINLGRANAIELTARLLRFIRRVAPVRIVSLAGGSKDNAIPRDCTVVFAAPSTLDAAAAISDAVALTRHTLCDDDREFSVETVEAPVDGCALGEEDSTRIIDFLSVFRSGPVTMSPEIPDMVESSYNLASVKLDSGEIQIVVSFRSSVEASLDDMTESMLAFGRLAGLNARCHSRYPGWSFAESSPLRELYLSVWKELFERDGTALGIHAGLECGLLVSRIPDMDIISIGPDIKDLHSPSETLGIASFDRLYETVINMLEKC